MESTPSLPSTSMAPDPRRPDTAGFKPDDPICLVDGRDREFLVVIPPPGETVRIKGELVPSEMLCALRPGELLTTQEHYRYLAVTPSLEQVVMNMPRQAQVIYPKDLAIIVFYADIAPGQTVLEVGAGHGALTMTLLRALGPQGCLITYDLRRDHLNRTRKNIARYLGEEFVRRWEPIEADPGELGFSHGPASSIISDVPEPWELAESVAAALKPGGIWLAYLPTVLQVGRLVETIQGSKELMLPRTFETLQRYWQVRMPSIRPTHQMKAHTGFIITCRRRFLPEPPD